MHDLFAVQKHLKPFETWNFADHTLFRHLWVRVWDSSGGVWSAKMRVAAEREHFEGVGSEVFSKTDDKGSEAGVEDGVVVAADGVEGDEVGDGKMQSQVIAEFRVKE